MPPLNIRDKSSLSVTAGLAVAAAFLVAGVTGCSSAGRYSAASLPPELQAPPIGNVQEVDLSRFAGPPVDSEMIDRGDVLEVSLAAGLNAEDVTNLTIRVGEDGTALLPEIGRFQLAGLHLMEAEQQIAAACVHRGLYRQPHATVTMKRQRTNRVTVVGGVSSPGIHELPRGSSYLLAALVAAGGLSEDAGTRVEIQHPATARPPAWQQPPSYGAPGIRQAGNATPVAGAQATRVCLNLVDAVRQGSGGEYLYDGSVVTVEKRYPEPIQVIGLVNKPGQYDFPVNHDLRLFGAIAQAGGLASRLANDVLVLRKAPDEQGFATIKVSLQEAKKTPEQNLRLAPGDIVSVEQSPATVVSDAIGKVIRFGMSASVPLF
jgi:polysaccharide export outer membrane protein